jgi:hypothetical protein
MLVYVETYGPAALDGDPPARPPRTAPAATHGRGSTGARLFLLLAAHLKLNSASTPQPTSAAFPHTPIPHHLHAGSAAQSPPRTLVVFVFVCCCRSAHPGGLPVRSRAAMERYEVIRDIGSGNFGVAKLVRDVRTKELFAVKFIERGQMVTANHRPFLVPSPPQRSSFFFFLNFMESGPCASVRQGIAGVRVVGYRRQGKRLA